VRDPRPLHELFAEQADRTPDRTAAVCGDLALTYRELANRAARLAERLAALGIRPDTPVGLCCERSLDMVVGILGILQAGGAYLPLDPDYPRERLELMVEEAGAAVVLATESARGAVVGMKAQLVPLASPSPVILSVAKDLGGGSSPLGGGGLGQGGGQEGGGLLEGKGPAAVVDNRTRPPT
jgi:non-ribosomal peptide synthetase component F